MLKNKYKFKINIKNIPVNAKVSFREERKDKMHTQHNCFWDNCIFFIKTCPSIKRKAKYNNEPKQYPK